MNIWLTNLKNSQRIKELGVEIPCTYYWQKQITWFTHVFKAEGSYPAYTLDQLFPVLQEIGKTKEWEDYKLETVEYCFLRICELVTTDPEAAQGYLSMLLE
mgnify:CR=1 FL=1